MASKVDLMKPVQSEVYDLLNAVLDLSNSEIDFAASEIQQVLDKYSKKAANAGPQLT